MAFISANGTVVEQYQVEELQKAVAADLESKTEEVSVEELLAQPSVEEKPVVQPVVEETQEVKNSEPEVKNGPSEAGNDPKNSEKAKL